MSLRYALLGFLQSEPRSGYDLKRAFDTSVRHFWWAQHSQIYTTLARLSEEGLVTVEEVPQEGRPDRKVYTITDAGRWAMDDWLTGIEPGILGKSAFLLQVFFMGLLTDEQVIGLLERRAACIRQSIEALRSASPEGALHTSADPRAGFFQGLTLDYGLRLLAFTADWIDETVERVRRGVYRGGRDAAVAPTPRP